MGREEKRARQMRVENLEGKTDEGLTRDREKRMRAENWEDRVDGGEMGGDGGDRWNEGG